MGLFKLCPFCRRHNLSAGHTRAVIEACGNRVVCHDITEGIDVYRADRYAVYYYGGDKSAFIRRDGECLVGAFSYVYCSTRAYCAACLRGGSDCIGFRIISKACIAEIMFP